MASANLLYSKKIIFITLIHPSRFQKRRGLNLLLIANFKNAVPFIISHTFFLVLTQQPVFKIQRDLNTCIFNIFNICKQTSLYNYKLIRTTANLKKKLVEILNQNALYRQWCNWLLNWLGFRVISLCNFFF